MLCLHLLTFASCRELQKQNKESLQRSLEQIQKQGMQRKQRHNKDPDHVAHLTVGEITDVFYLSSGNTFVTCGRVVFFLNLSSHSFLPTPHRLYPKN